MADSICRLCLSDKLDTLISIFSDKHDSNISLKIQQLLAVQVQKEDKLSTLICNECIIRLETWQSYKVQCTRNQAKLIEIYNKKIKTEVRSEPQIETNASVKSEPEDFDSIDTDEVTLHSPTKLPIKVEISDSSINGEYNEVPPTLTPNELAPTEKSVKKSIKSSTIQTDENKTCPECDRTFCSIYSMKRHKKVIHKKKRSKHSQFGSKGHKQRFLNVASTSVDNSPNSSSSIGQNNNDESINMEINDNMQNNPNGEMLTIRNLSPLEEKVQFAAGLKLVQKDPLETILSKVELSYAEKCRAMVSMFTTHKCACHNVQYNSLRNLLSHLKEVKSWFPLFTCYSCMISFPDRSSFSVHYSKCPRANLETIKKLAGLNKRSKSKNRLYQNYKCNLCKFIYSFHDDFCTHVAETHAVGKLPFICSCKLQFDTIDSYKSHCSNSCLLSYYCDICYESLSTRDEFLKHCLENHDTAEGFTLLQKASNASRKSLQNKEIIDEAKTVYGKRNRKINLKSPIAKKVSAGKKEISSSLVRKLLNMEEPRPESAWKEPAMCPYCQKFFSSTHNMTRHYKIHLEKGEVPMSKVIVTTSQASYSCSYCSTLIKTSEWKNHVENHHPSKKCPDCCKIFRSKKELDEHKKSHLSVTLYRDSKTNSYRITPSPETESLKHKKVIGGAMVACETCDIMFTNKNDLKKHKLTCHRSIGASSTPLQSSVEDIDLPLLEPVIDIEVAKEKRDNLLSASFPATLISCDVCSKEYSTPKSLQQHMRNKHGIRKNCEFPKTCEHCDKVCYTGASLYLHTQIHLRNNLPSAPKKRKIDNSAVTVNIKQEADTEDGVEGESYYTCNRCYKVFGSKFKLKKHMKVHGVQKKSSPKKAKVNPMSIDNKIEASAHLALMELKMEKQSFQWNMQNTSNKNNESFDSVNFGNSNTQDDNSDKPFECHLCHKFFRTLAAKSSHIRWHKRINEGDMDMPSTSTPIAVAPAKLIRNTKAASTAISAAGTVATTSNKSESKEFQCTVCSLQLANETALQIHTLQKHRNIDAKMLIPRCTTCNEDFKTQSAYDVHKRYHYLLERQQQQVPENPVIPNSSTENETKQLTCTICNITYKQSEVFKAHMKLYHEFKCEYCPRMFTKQNSLNAHLKVHEKKKKKTNSTKVYSCSICKASFSHRIDLVAHTVKEHPF